MDPRLRRLLVFAAVAAILAGACGATNATSPPTATPSAGVPVSPSDPQSPRSFASVASPTAPPTTPSTPAAHATSWTKAQLVGVGKNCSDPGPGIDAAGRHHIVAECHGSIHYFVSTAGGPWIATTFPHPAHRLDLSPVLAFWGNTVYIAYPEFVPLEGGCGDTGLRAAGVFFRSRDQPDGAWSRPIRIGSPDDDSLVSFDVMGATIHATVNNSRAGGMYYETLTGRTLHRYRIPGAAGPTSVEIGGDGRARIAYATSSGLRYAVFTGSGFSTFHVPGTTHVDSAPEVVTDANDKVHVLWTRTVSADGGCASAGPPPLEGTYYGTDASGTWKSQRITKDTGEHWLHVDAGTGHVQAVVNGDRGPVHYSKDPGGAWKSHRITGDGRVWSIRFDQRTGRAHILVGGKSGLSYYTMNAAGGWARTLLPSTKPAESAVILVDPATGGLLVAYQETFGSGMTVIYAMTKP